VSYAEEFSTVDLILASGADTLGVDAFALSLIKAERQARKLVTYLVYQSPVFGKGDGRRLRMILAANKRVYFEGVVAGLDALSPIPVKELVGPEYEHLWERFREFGKHRNKIFHGQLTTDGLNRDQLLKNVEDIRLWCRTLGTSATREFGCDGFIRNTFQKAPLKNLSMRLRVRIESLDQYSAFIRSHMVR
jgi:hypothetical protein